MSFVFKYINYLDILEYLLKRVAYHPCAVCGKKHPRINTVIYKDIRKPDLLAMVGCPEHMEQIIQKIEENGYFILIHAYNDGTYDNPYWKIIK